MNSQSVARMIRNEKLVNFQHVFSFGSNLYKDSVHILTNRLNFCIKNDINGFVLVLVREGFVARLGVRARYEVYPPPLVMLRSLRTRAIKLVVNC